MSDWYYADASGAQIGPISFEDLSGLVRSGAVSADQKAWTEGMADWQSVGQIAELASLVPAGTNVVTTQASANPYQASATSGVAAGQVGATLNEAPSSWLWQSIVALCFSLLLSCFCFPLLGIATSIVALVFASGVNTKWISGKHDLARDAAKKAKLWALISFGIIAFGLALNLILSLTGVFKIDNEQWQRMMKDFESQNMPTPVEED